MANFTDNTTQLQNLLAKVNELPSENEYLGELNIANGGTSSTTMSEAVNNTVQHANDQEALITEISDTLREKSIKIETCTVTMVTDDGSSVSSQYMPIWYLDETFSVQRVNAGGKDENGKYDSNGMISSFRPIKGGLICMRNVGIENLSGDIQRLPLDTYGYGVYVFGDGVIDYC